MGLSVGFCGEEFLELGSMSARQRGIDFSCPFVKTIEGHVFRMEILCIPLFLVCLEGAQQSFKTEFQSFFAEKAGWLFQCFDSRALHIEVVLSDVRHRQHQENRVPAVIIALHFLRARQGTFAIIF